MRVLVSRCISSPSRHWQTHRLDCAHSFLLSLYWLSLIIFFLLFPSTLIFFSPANAPTTLSPHQGCKNWRSAFQWKPLINTNLHLNCNLILTTYALSVNWISHLKDKAVLELALRQYFKARCSGSALVSLGPNSSFTFSAKGSAN